MKKLKLIALLFAIIVVDFCRSVSLYTNLGESVHLNDNRLPKKLQPVDVMADLTNQAGFKVLKLHSQLNKNNIAFSPCGLMSVLVALYEGSNGKSTIEIKDALEFPNEKDIVRVGVRDIHRRLRSYFYKKENLLSGLIFNKENITIRPEYETILRFYGYDIDTSSSMVTESQMNNEQMMNENVTTTTEMSTKAEEQTTVEQKSSAAPETSEAPETTVESETTKAEEETTIAEDSSPPEETSVASEVNEDETTEVPTTTEEEVTEATEAPLSRKRAARGRLSRNTGQKNKKNKADKNISNHHRSGRSYNLFEGNQDVEDVEYEYHLAVSPPPEARTAVSNKYLNKHDQDLFENVNTDMVEHLFYLDEYESIRVPYKIYDTVMKFAYIETLHASAIEIDLDTDFYTLIILMPEHQSGLAALVEKLCLHDANLLRHIRGQLDYQWVKTIVPKFSLKGNTLLTNDLQNMGIADIFEPTKADFSLLAEDANIYVKNVEQSININIRTQTTQQLKKISSLYKNPIEMPINSPFVFFVIDKELDLAIIMGRIVNPLNSRIQ